MVCDAVLVGLNINSIVPPFLGKHNTFPDANIEFTNIYLLFTLITFVAPSAGNTVSVTIVGGELYVNPYGLDA